MVLKAIKTPTWLSISVTSCRDHRRFNILPTKAVSEDQGSVLSVNLPSVVHGEVCVKGQDLAVRLALDSSFFAGSFRR